jgi:hypothetical protein
MKELRLPLDFSSTLFKIINLYYISKRRRVDARLEDVFLKIV